MALNNVIIQQRAGSSGRALTGNDHHTGYMFYGTAPTVSGKWESFTNNGVTIKAQKMFSAGDIATAGILPNTDNTAATAVIEITTAATAAGEKVILSVDAPLPNSLSETVSLGTYTTVSGDTVIDTLGANLTAFINAGTVTHGFSASYSTGDNEITVSAPKKYGVSLNSGTPLDVDVTDSDIVVAVTQFTGGTASLYAVWDYHLRETFRLFPKAVVYVGIISATSAYAELVALQNYTGGLIRQIGIFDKGTSTSTAANISATLLSIYTSINSLYQTFPLVAVYCGNIIGVTDLSTLPDQNLNTSQTVQSVISQDGNAEGATLYVRCGFTIGNLGVKVATIAKSRVSSSDAQPVPDFNVSDGTENNVIAFGNGQLFASLSDNLISQLDSYRYTFLRNFGGELAGSYWTDNKTCIVSTSDYCFLNDVRVFQKATRILRNAYIPLLSSETIFNGDGTLKDTTIAYFKSQGENAITANMITGYGDSPLISGVAIDIDPTQKVRATNNLTVVATIVANGISRSITIPIGFGTI